MGDGNVDAITILKWEANEKAQRLMADNAFKDIYKLVMKNGVSVVDLTENQLEQWLDNN